MKKYFRLIREEFYADDDTSAEISTFKMEEVTQSHRHLKFEVLEITSDEDEKLIFKKY